VLSVLKRRLSAAVGRRGEAGAMHPSDETRSALERREGMQAGPADELPSLVRRWTSGDRGAS